MFFNRFDICSAYYVFFALHHGGQNSHGYKKLSQLIKIGFSPSPMLDFNSLTDNGKEIFIKLWGKNSDLYSLLDFMYEEIKNEKEFNKLCDLAAEIFRI